MRRLLHRIQPIAHIRKRSRRRREMKQRKAAINNNKLFIDILSEVMSKFDNKQQNN